MGNYSTPEAYVFNDGNSNNANSIIAMLPALLQNRGVDPSLIAMCCGNRGGAFGSNGLSDIIALIVIAAIFGNGNFGLFGGNRGGGCALPNMINNDSNTQLLMQMLQRNGADVQSLANMTNTSTDAIIAAINSVSKEICNLGINNGQSFNQVLTAIMQGNNALQTQLANCCCTLRDAITQQGYQTQLGQKDIQNSMLMNFGQLGNQLATDACAIRQNSTDNTGRILAKLDAIEDSRKDREIATLTAQLATVNARAERQAELAPIVQKLNDIQCKQPNTVTVPYQPFVTVPNCVAYQAFGLGGYPLNGGNFG